MLNERERRVLARIERHLTTSDPEFVQLFEAAARRTPAAGVSPRLLLVVGLAVLVLGTATTALPIAALGMVVSFLALAASFRRTGPAGFSAA